MLTRTLITRTLLGITLASCAMLIAADAVPASQPVGEKIKTPSGLTMIKTVQGTGEAASGDMVWVLYTGKLETTGAVFDSTSDRNNVPYMLTLGRGSVIKGWDEGLVGMKVGDKRTLIIPPDLAYGAEARGDKIPANSTLVFDIELVGLKKSQPTP
jgi:FKBP-type peptidyl-prolyl cis-trans isomerase